MKIRQKSRRGFTLIEIMIAVSIIGLLATIAIPNFLRARKTSQVNACISNLRTIDGAKQQWALECGKSTETPANGDIKPYIGRGDAGSLGSTYCPLVAPGDLAGYKINDLKNRPSCIQYDDVTHPAVLD